MPSLQRFTNPQTRPFSLNIKSLPGAKLYFYAASSTTPKATYSDKQGTTANANPVVADSSGIFPPIFLDGLYRVELRSSANIVQSGWPIDNVGQDSVIVPFGPYSPIVTYNEGEVVTGENGNWYRSIVDNNLGNEPSASPSDWELIPIPVASSFTSNVPYITFSDDVDQISLDLDQNALALALSPRGTFTPVVYGATTAGSATYSVQSGKYTQIGNIVHFTINLEWTGHTGTGLMRVNGFPSVMTNNSVALSVWNAEITYPNVPVASLGARAELVSGATVVKFYAMSEGVTPSQFNIDTEGRLTLTGFYFTD